MTFTRPQSGFRFNFGGLNTNDPPDALPPNKYPIAANVRGLMGNAIRTRPGYTIEYTPDATKIVTDIRAYSTLGTDNLPRILSRDAANQIYLDTGALITTLEGTIGKGVVMLPFRPNASPQSWMYIASSSDYKKLSAPDANNVVVVNRVGITEPQSPIEFGPTALHYTDLMDVPSSWTNDGACGTISAVANGSDVVAELFPDPVVPTRYTVRINVDYLSTYLPGDFAIIGGLTLPILEVIPEIPSGFTSASVFYHSDSSIGQGIPGQTNGLCTITINAAPSSSAFLGSLKRGAILKLNYGIWNEENVLVLNVVMGTDSICFDCVTINNHGDNEGISGLPSIIVDGAIGGSVGSSLTFLTQRAQSVITLDADPTKEVVGTVSRSFLLSDNPFNKPFASTSVFPRDDDYINLLLDLDLDKLVSLDIIFNVGYDSTDWTHNTLVYSVTQAQLVQNNVDSTSFQLAINDPRKLTRLSFPIRSLVHKTSNSSLTLSVCNGIRIKVTMTGGDTSTLTWGAMWVGGGGLPDVGSNNPGYMYVAVPRNSSTGNRGNSTPTPYYSVYPHRQPVTLTVPSSAYDSQITLWDFYRYGGTVTSWRYIGSTKAGESTFTDNYSDAHALSGDVLETDNYEPWPTVGLPFSVTSDGFTTITVSGTWVIVSGVTIVWPDTIDRWLPGTLILLNGTTAYTLRSRPMQLSSTSYLFALVENAGTPTVNTLWVQEPNVACQRLPYVWGPNEQGDVFACGDPLRPGTLYYSKSFSPDSAPDSFNRELTPPSEPLVGGKVVNGVSFVSSTNRWWAMYPAKDTPKQYYPVERPIGRGLITPYGYCTDGTFIYFWARDGIWVTDTNSGKSITDADLYNIFPHEGVPGKNYTYFGQTVYAPDYSRAATFRLYICNGYLYADYQDSTGTYRNLVFDIDLKAWCVDEYANQIAVHYAIEQQVAGYL